MTTNNTNPVGSTVKPVNPVTTYVAPKMKTVFKERPTASPKVIFNERIIPYVTIKKAALDKMRLYVEEMEKEIGWLGTTARIDNDIIITDVFLFEQDVHATTTEITPEGLAAFAEELLMQPDGMEIWNSMKMWGHSHVRMGITPSGQDDKQMKEFEEAGHDYFVRLIANKHGEMKLDVYEYAKGLEFHDVPWFAEESEGNQEKVQEIETLKSQMAAIQAQIDATQKEIESENDAEVEAQRAEIAAEIKQKVSSIPPYVAPRPAYQGGAATPSYGRSNYGYGGYNYGYGYGYGGQTSQGTNELYEDALTMDLTNDKELTDNQIKEMFAQNTHRVFLSHKDILAEFSTKELTLMQNTIHTIGDLRYELYHTGYYNLTPGDINYLWGYVQNVFKLTDFKQA